MERLIDPRSREINRVRSEIAVSSIIIGLDNHAAKVIAPSEAVCSCGVLRTIEVSTKFGSKSSLEPAFLAS